MTITTDRIERETLIAASIERVWTLVSRPGFWAGGGSEKASGEQPVAGDSLVVTHEDAGDFPVRVEQVQEPTFISYRWVSAFPGEAFSEEKSTLVEFTLTEQEGGTLLKVVESGFGTLPTPEDNQQHVVDDHTEGWEACIDALVAEAA